MDQGWQHPAVTRKQLLAAHDKQQCPMTLKQCFSASTVCLVSPSGRGRSWPTLRCCIIGPRRALLRRSYEKLKARGGFVGEDRVELLKVEWMLRTFAATEK